MKLLATQKAGSLIGWGGIILALVVVWLVLLPALRRIAETQLRVNELQAEVDQKQREVESLRNLLKQGQASNRRLELLSLAAPAKPQIPELLVMVETMAGKSQTVLTNASPSQSETGTKLDITLSGGYGGMVSFLEHLNRNLRPGAVKTLSVVTQEAQGGGSELSAAVSVEFVGGAAAAQKERQPQTPQQGEEGR